jgi:hypothetical protein
MLSGVSNIRAFKVRRSTPKYAAILLCVVQPTGTESLEMATRGIDGFCSFFGAKPSNFKPPSCRFGLEPPSDFLLVRTESSAILILYPCLLRLERPATGFGGFEEAWQKALKSARISDWASLLEEHRRRNRRLPSHILLLEAIAVIKPAPRHPKTSPFPSFSSPIHRRKSLSCS